MEEKYPFDGALFAAAGRAIVERFEESALAKLGYPSVAEIGTIIYKTLNQQ
jgi:hypothetical protein